MNRNMLKNRALNLFLMGINVIFTMISMEPSSEQQEVSAYILSRDPGSYLSYLPRELQKELLQYYQGLYYRLIHQESKKRDALWIPTFDQFRDLIAHTPIRLYSVIHIQDPQSNNQMALANLLLNNEKVDIVRLFVENRKLNGTDWEGLAADLLALRLFNVDDPLLNEYLQLYKLLIEFAPEEKRSVLYKMYSNHRTYSGWRHLPRLTNLMKGEYEPPEY